MFLETKAGDNVHFKASLTIRQIYAIQSRNVCPFLWSRSCLSQMSWRPENIKRIRS